MKPLRAKEIARCPRCGWPVKPRGRGVAVKAACSNCVWGVYLRKEEE